MGSVSKRVVERFVRASGYSLPGVVDGDLSDWAGRDGISWTWELDMTPGVMKWGTFKNECEQAVQRVEAACDEVAKKLGQGLGIRVGLTQTRCTVSKTGKFSVTAALRFVAADNEELLASKKKADWLTANLPGFKFIAGK